jgi:hypothetical protein
MVIYLVKISSKLEQTMEDYVDDETSFEESEDLYIDEIEDDA